MDEVTKKKMLKVLQNNLNILCAQARELDKQRAKLFADFFKGLPDFFAKWGERKKEILMTDKTKSVKELSKEIIDLELESITKDQRIDTQRVSIEDLRIDLAIRTQQIDEYSAICVNHEKYITELEEELWQAKSEKCTFIDATKLEHLQDNLDYKTVQVDELRNDLMEESLKSVAQHP